MPVDKFAADTLSWGCLVKSWATGLDYVSAGYADTAFPGQPPRPPWQTATRPIPAGAAWALPTPLPGGGVTLPLAVSMTPAQFLALLTAASVQGATGPGSTPHMPAQYQKVIVVQGDAQTLVIRLPPKDKIQQAEDDIIQNGYSAPPDFYQTLYTAPGAPPVGPFMPSGEGPEMKLHANRIGDYTMNSCN